MRLILLILFEIVSLCAEAQTISAIVIDWVDTQVETPWDITSYYFDKGNFETYRKIISVC